MMRCIALYILLLVLLVSCTPVQSPVASPAPSPLAVVESSPTPMLSPTSTPLPQAVWIAPAVPASLRAETVGWGLPPAEQPDAAALRLDIGSPSDENSSVWVYALVSPFPTILDGISSEELSRAWAGEPPDGFPGLPLMMDASTLSALSAQWGEPAPGAVRIVPQAELLETAWAEAPSWAVIPFEDVVPQWKVLGIDGQSPLHKQFDLSAYPLKVRFFLTCTAPCPVSPLPALPPVNRDPARLSTVVMTGVTALVRSTAYTMENKGVLYPGHLIRDWLREADIAHISNEVSFFSKCPFPNPNQTNLIFCSSQRYMDLLLDVGTDVVEITGDHLIDYGHAAMLESLAFYRETGLPYYGGGANLDDARQPLLVEDGVNKFAFIGCNAKGNAYAKATQNTPGPAPCDFEYMTEQIRRLSDQGYLVIATFQWHESYGVMPHPLQVRDFRRMADAGAVIVSGSQAHLPQEMEFYNGAFIHYGLGNLFFDQMYYNRPDGVVLEDVRREFIDRHVFYDGRYLGVELLTAMLEDYATPRPMEMDERFNFLRDIFSASGWKFVENTPMLTPTPSPAPLILSTPLSTSTP